MKQNLPVTQNEIAFPKNRYIVSRTDLKGLITYANDTFIEMSGFTVDELIGKNHNLVRHPDMPVAAFRWLWDTIQSGRPWRGTVKNRAKNGDFYWVNALVVPVLKNDQIIGYMSVRTEPTQAEKEGAAALYKTLNEQKVLALPKPSRFAQISLATKQKIGVLSIFIAQLWSLASHLFGSAAGLSEEIIRSSLYGVTFFSLIVGVCLLQNQNKSTRYLNALSLRLKNIAQGELTDDIPFDRIDDLGRLNDDIITMQTHLKSMMAEIIEATRIVENNADMLQNRMRTTQNIAHHQSSSLEEIAASIEELVASINEVAKGTEETSQSVVTSRTLLDAAVLRMNDSNAASNHVALAVNQAEANMSNLYATVASITKVTNVIRGIADQTNLLALNAAIEAARAGESGRGFAVVADEVRKLAEISAQQTTEIATSVESIQRVTNVAVETMSQASKHVTEANSAADSARQGLEEVTENGNTLAAISSQIADNTHQQSAVGDAIYKRVDDIAQGVEKTSVEITEAAEQSGQMKDAASQLKKILSYFRYIK